jgi:hypothetical protein
MKGTVNSEKNAVSDMRKKSATMASVRKELVQEDIHENVNSSSSEITANLVNCMNIAMISKTINQKTC